MMEPDGKKFVVLGLRHGRADPEELAKDLGGAGAGAVLRYLGTPRDHVALRGVLRREHRGLAQAHRLRVLLPDEEQMPEGLTLIEQEEWKERHGEAS